MGAVPEGYVRIWTDTDGDGRFDSVETIYAFDLEQARRSSADRRGGGPGGMQGGEEGGMWIEERVEGKIRDLKHIRLYGMGEEHTLARVETREGRTARVDLGPRKALAGLNLKDGDQVSVAGLPGLINDREVLMASRVESGGKTVQVEPTAARSLQRVKGQVTGIRTAKFRGREGDQIIADLRLHSGRRETVILGPRSSLSDLEIKRGDELAVLVRPGRLNGNSALVAEQVRAGDRTIEIQRTSTRNRTTSKSGDNQRESGGEGSSGDQSQGSKP